MESCVARLLKFWKSEIQNWFGTLEKQINELTVFLTTVSVTVS